ncbi:MAG: phospholipase D family protein [Chitinophagaceae bacterium]
MAKFITGNELNHEIGKLFESAEKQLLLISPYMKLHHRFESTLLRKRNNDKLEITVVFGKNEDNPAKSIRAEDVEFFKQFPNIEIRYEKRLHAKYFANEFSAIITSMNLYDYSQDNNIESGILMVQHLGRGLLDNLDDQVYNYFNGVMIEQSELLYSKKPNYKEGFLAKKYVDSTVTVDKLNSFFNSGKASKKNQPVTKTASLKPDGYCIITGENIPFDIKQPMNLNNFKAWQKKKDLKFKGSFCHFSGEKAVTSFEKPIVSKNWKKAKEMHDL